MDFANLVGQTIGQYRLIELLGVGGMGAVYRAEQISLGREVAVKVMSTALTDQPGYLERFNREARLSAALQHPHIVTVHDFGSHQDLTFVVMQLLTGGSLEQRMRQRPTTPPSLGEVVDLLSGVSAALDYAHSRGVIHRDIKPANIVFDSQGKGYLVDFGIAKLIDDNTASLTGNGMAMGSPAYMPPEQWKGEGPKPSSDQYALAVTAYSVLTGKMPFEGTDTPSWIHKHLYEEPTPLTKLRPDLPLDTMLVLGRAMAKNPADRWPSCVAFAEALRQSATGLMGETTNFFQFPLEIIPQRTLTPPGPSVPRLDQPHTTKKAAPRSSLPFWIIGGIVFVVAVVGGVAALLSSPIGGGETPTAVAVVPSETPTATITPSDTPTPITLTSREIAEATRNYESTLAAEFATLDALDLTKTATLHTPTASLTSTPTPTITPEPTDTPTLSPTQTATNTRMPRPTRTPTQTLEPSPTASLTLEPTATQIPRPMATEITPMPSVFISSLFAQDFEDSDLPLGITTRSGGEWLRRRVDGQIAYCNSRSVSDEFDVLLWGDRRWDDYIVSIDVLFNGSNTHAEVYTRFDGTTALNAYRSHANMTDGTVSLAYASPETALGGNDFLFERNQWYTLRVESDGRLMRYWVDDQLLVQTRRAFQREFGFVGFLVHPGGRVCIDNLRVWAVEEPEGARIGTVTASGSIRSGAAVGFSVVGEVRRNDRIVVLGQHTNTLWLRVRNTIGQEGWISSSLINVRGELPIWRP